MTHQEIRQYAIGKAKERPDLKDQIMDLLDLCLDEIDCGSSSDEEYEKFASGIRALETGEEL